jgi:ATP-binding cassette subfamily F protein uup
VEPFLSESFRDFGRSGGFNCRFEVHEFMSSTPNVSALLSVSELRLAFGLQAVLDGATLSVLPGEKVGLVGRNGCGKTSLFRILAGETQADSGEISLRRGLRVGYLPQEFQLDGERTVRENIEAGAADLLEWIRRYEAGEGSEAELAALQHDIQHADGWHLTARVEAAASALGTPSLDAKVGPLSGGEKRRVALCRALVGQPDLLLLDEPTNHLDAESIRWLEEFLRGFPGAVIFVTHDRYFLDVIATRVIELADGRCFSHPGNYTAYLESKAVRQQIAEQSERRRQRFLREELEWVRAGVRAQRSKSRHRLDKYYAIAGLEAPPEEREMDLLIPPPPELGNTVVELIDAGARVGDGEGERWLFRGLNLVLQAGQCTGVVGRNGAGKTTLLRICLGERAPDEGTATIGKKVVFNYIDQTRMQLDGGGTVMAEIAGKGDIVLFGEQKLNARSYLRRFLFGDDRVKEPVSKLSGGERARLMLAKVLCRGGNVLILDEPTNDLDLPSLRMLEEALVDFDGAVLVVSHDRYFLDRICDQVVAFEDSGVVVGPGNYSYYLEKRKEREARARAWTAAASGAERRESAQAQAAKAVRPRKLGFKEQRELAGMEEAIQAAEARVADLETTLHDPAFYATRAKEAPALMAELEVAKAEVVRLYARWEELEALPK